MFGHRLEQSYRAGDVIRRGPPSHRMTRSTEKRLEEPRQVPDLKRLRVLRAGRVEPLFAGLGYGAGVGGGIWSIPCHQLEVIANQVRILAEEGIGLRPLDHLDIALAALDRYTLRPRGTLETQEPVNHRAEILKGLPALRRLRRNVLQLVEQARAPAALHMANLVLTQGASVTEVCRAEFRPLKVESANRVAEPPEHGGVTAIVCPLPTSGH